MELKLWHCRNCDGTISFSEITIETNEEGDVTYHCALCGSTDVDFVPTPEVELSLAAKEIRRYLLKHSEYETQVMGAVVESLTASIEAMQKNTALLTRIADALESVIDSSSSLDDRAAYVYPWQE